MSRKPSPQPSGYDPRRVARLAPVRNAIEALGLPPVRSRKLMGILNALTMQIEDGGDSPEVNRLLLDALRAAVRHQVGDVRGGPALQAMDGFQRAEEQPPQYPG